jgi:hypothetical protein
MIYELHIGSWIKLVDMFAEGLSGYIYRGQSEYGRDLSSLIERISHLHGRKNDNLYNREFWILTQFKRRAHNILLKPPAYDDAIEWLALIQHHGGPTRLLDFTSSAYIALFFACERAKSDAALWMINEFEITDRHAPLKSEDTIYHQNKTLLGQAKELVGVETKESGILPIVPELINERMAIQQGLSLMPKNLGVSFMENLKKEYDWSRITYKKIALKHFKEILHTDKNPSVIKIRIRKEWHHNVLHALDQMNINAKTLFPGVDGFARSLRLHLYTNF